MQKARVHFTRLMGTRIVATPDALEGAHWPTDAIVLRFAADEIYLTAPLSAADQTAILAQDAHALIINEGAFSAVWIDEARSLALLERFCEWEIPADRPAFAQGAVAGIPTKLWLTQGRFLWIVQSPYVEEMEDRLA